MSAPLTARCIEIGELFFDRPRLDAWQATRGLAEQVLALGEENLSEEVRPVKAAWWDEELQRLAAGLPRHPLAQAACTTAGDAASRALTAQWLVAVRTQRPDDETSRTTFQVDAFRRFGVALMLAFPHAERAAHRETIVAVGTGLSALDMIDVALVDPGERAGVAAICASCEAAALDAGDNGLAALGAAVATALRAVLDGRDVVTLSLLWRAWRAARRSRKGSSR